MIYLLIVIVIILVMPIKVVAARDDVRGDVDIFTKIFDLRLDFDQLVRRCSRREATRNASRPEAFS